MLGVQTLNPYPTSPWSTMPGVEGSRTGKRKRFPPALDCGPVLGFPVPSSPSLRLSCPVNPILPFTTHPCLSSVSPKKGHLHYKH